MTDTRLLEAERDLLLTKIGRLDMQIAIAEGAWTGSHGGHDPDFYKLKGGLVKFWREKARTHPHPFTYCVRHLREHVANPERLCAWLKDQALGTTKWRKNKKRGLRESAMEDFTPTIDEMRAAMCAYREAAEDLGLCPDCGHQAAMCESHGDTSEEAPTGSSDEGREAQDLGSNGDGAGAQGAETGGEGADDEARAGDSGEGEAPKDPPAGE